MHHPIGTELATVDGITYVSLPDAVTLPPDQPPEILGSIAMIAELTPELKAKIKAASPHVRLINERVAAKIAERYSANDEIKLIRLSPSPEYDEYNAYAEECRAWGKAQKAALGL